MKHLTKITTLYSITLTLLASATFGLSGCATKPSYRPNAQPKIITNARGVPNYYLVKNGDTVSQIAQRYGLSYQQIGRLNQLDRQYTIYAGQWLKLWQSQAHTTYPNNSYPRNSYPNKAKPTAYPPSINTSVSPQTQKVPTLSTPTINQPVLSSTPLYPTTVNSSIGYIYPTQNPVISNFDAATGNDSMIFSGKEGDPVVAIQNGQVIYVGNGLPKFGNLIIIRHDDNTLSNYAQNSQMLVKEKQIVRKGQHIANMSQKGLKLQIRENGKPIDPRAILGR